MWTLPLLDTKADPGPGFGTRSHQEGRVQSTSEALANFGLRGPGNAHLTVRPG